MTQPAVFRRTTIGVFLGLVALVTASAVSGNGAAPGRESVLAIDAPITVALAVESTGSDGGPGASAPYFASDGAPDASDRLESGPGESGPADAATPGGATAAPSTSARSGSIPAVDLAPLGPVAPVVPSPTPPSSSSGAEPPVTTVYRSVDTAPDQGHPAPTTTTARVTTTSVPVTTKGTTPGGANPTSMKTTSTVLKITVPTATLAELTAECDPNYAPCVPIAAEVDCAAGIGDGPTYVTGPVRVIGRDIYHLDSDGNGIGCDS